MTPINADGEVIEELKAEIEVLKAENKRLTEALQTARAALRAVLTLPRPRGDYGGPVWAQWDDTLLQIGAALRTARERKK